MDSPDPTGHDGPHNRHQYVALLDEEVSAAASVDVNILFTGGASAKRLARRIHSLRRGRPGRFMAVDCGWPEPVLERQLFGVLGTDTYSAQNAQAMPLPVAGTLFLEEVGRLGETMQKRLLDVLGQVPYRGGRRVTRARVMASTSEALIQRVIEGTFDDRLFYRLNAIHFVLAPEPGDA